jgi:hypothetical protein
VTDAEWLACRNPFELLAQLPPERRVRQRYLLACACWRSIPLFLTDPALRSAVESLEAAADSGRELGGWDDVLPLWEVGVRLSEQVWNPFGPGYRPVWEPETSRLAAVLILETALLTDSDDPRHESEADDLADHAANRGPAVLAAWEGQSDRQGSLLRDIFGNPFRPVRVDPSAPWLRDRAVQTVARAIYDEHEFGQLPFLADLLEEAGCDCDELLGHLRAPAEHARGCWALDLVTGRE